MPYWAGLGVIFNLTLFLAMCDAQKHSPEPNRTSTNTTQVQIFSSATRVNGWVNQPNYRGTFDIIWTSLVTIFISTYTMLCLNIPAATDTYIRRTSRRFLWMCLGILGPEFPLTYAAGQWSRAKHSVAAFRALGYDDWHMRHAFFADMGGFILHAKDDPPFPLNAMQLHWLVENHFVNYPRISRQDIEDKSKQDTFTKVITAFQVGYLIIQCMARAIQGLAITTLELNALAIVVCSLMTAYIWLYKPADVQTRVPVYSSHSLAEMTLNRPWSLTPLDFIDENGPGYSVNVQPFMKMPVIPSARPIQMIPNDRFPMNPYGIQEYFLCFATMVYTAIHVAGWSFDFPTRIERVLWRISSLVLFGITVAFWVFETTASWTRLGRWKAIYLYIFNRNGLEEHWMRMVRKTPTARRESNQLPLPWEFASIAPLAFTYGLARFYLLAEAFAELRDLQGTAYVNVDWTYFIPHA